MNELTLFLSLLQSGDEVAIYEGGDEDNTLSAVASVTGKYIRIERYPGLKFDRLSGKQVPSKKGNRTYRYLFSAEAFYKESAQADYKDDLLKLIDHATITKDIYEKMSDCASRVTHRLTLATIKKKTHLIKLIRCVFFIL